MHTARLLATALRLPALPTLPRVLDTPAVCVLSGEPITAGYGVMDITTSATNEYLDTFRGCPTGVVSETVARLFRQDHNMGARLVFEDGTAYHPLISRESAAATLHSDSPEVPPNPRPCWSDLVRAIWPQRQGQNLVCLLTTDTKKRLWPRARVGPLGESTPVFVHDGGLAVSASRQVSWPRLLTLLDLLEPVYGLGFSKRALAQNLLQETRTVQQLGLRAAHAHERALAPWRTSPEFAVALLLAQKALPSALPHALPAHETTEPTLTPRTAQKSENA